MVFKIYFMCMDVLSACMAVYRVHAWYSWRLEKPLGSLIPELQMAALQIGGSNLVPLQEQQVLLTTEQSLHRS